MALAFLVPPGVNLRSEFNAVNPKRDRSSDGWVGDARHAARVSDHNPRGDGSVLALDVDVNGVPMAKIVAFIVARCKTGKETRLQYVIFRRRIWSRSWGWTARVYRGSNPHTRHAHFSFRDGPAGRRGGSWGIAAEFGPHASRAEGASKPRASKPRPAVKHPAGSRQLALHSPPMSGADVVYVQDWIGEERCGPADGHYGPQTRMAVRWYQRMRGLTPDGIVGPSTWHHLGVRYTGSKT